MQRFVFSLDSHEASRLTLIRSARVGRHVTLTSGCVIGATCSLTTDEVLPENTVIFGSDHQRRTMPDRPAVSLVDRCVPRLSLSFVDSFKRINWIFSHAFFPRLTTFSSTAPRRTRLPQLNLIDALICFLFPSHPLESPDLTRIKRKKTDGERETRTQTSFE